MGKRLRYLDIVRGIAIILIVIEHVIRGLHDDGINILNYNYIDNIIYSIHLPIIFFISGFLESKYITFEKKLGKLFCYIKKNIISLYIPYFIFIYIFWFIKFFIFKENNDVSLSNIYILTFSGKWIFWFLLSLLFVKIIHSIFEFDKKNSSLALPLFLITYALNNFLSSKVFVWLSYGLLYSIGYHFEKYDLLEKQRSKVTVTSIIIVLTYLAFFSKNNLSIGMLMLGIPICVLLLCLFKNVKSLDILERLGKYSMIIYLIHTIFTSLVRTILFKLNIQSIPIHILLGTIIPLLISMYVVHLYKKVKYLRWIEYLFYPNKMVRYSYEK